MMSRKTWSYCGNDYASSDGPDAPRAKQAATTPLTKRTSRRSFERFIQTPFLVEDVRDLRTGRSRHAKAYRTRRDQSRLELFLHQGIVGNHGNHSVTLMETVWLPL